MMLITAADLREAKARHGGYCARGVDLWFKRHDLDLRHFLRNGYPIEVIEATKDELGLQVVAVAKERHAK